MRSDFCVIGILITLASHVYSCSQLGFNPFTRKLLQSSKVRHEIGQGVETEQTRAMEDLAKEYNELKERCHDKGKC